MNRSPPGFSRMWSEPCGPFCALNENGFVCCCAVASAAISGVVGQGSGCSKLSVVPGRYGSVRWLSSKPYTAQYTWLFRPTPPDGLHFAGEVTAFNLGGRHQKIAPEFAARSWVLAFSPASCWGGWKLLCVCAPSLCNPTSHASLADHIRHMNWAGVELPSILHLIFYL